MKLTVKRGDKELVVECVLAEIEEVAKHIPALLVSAGFHESVNPWTLLPTIGAEAVPACPYDNSFLQPVPPFKYETAPFWQISEGVFGPRSTTHAVRQEIFGSK